MTEKEQRKCPRRRKKQLASCSTLIKAEIIHSRRFETLEQLLLELLDDVHRFNRILFSRSTWIFVTSRVYVDPYLIKLSDLLLTIQERICSSIYT